MRELESRLARLLWTGRMVPEAARQPWFPFSSPSAIRRAQERRVRAVVADAAAHVPYYRETMRRLGLGAEYFHTADDLARLPLIDRDQLQRDPEYFLSDRWAPDACVTVHSGGSTGAPVTVFREPRSFFMEAAYNLRLRFIITRLAGRRLRYRAALIVSPDGSIATTVTAFRDRTQLPKNLQGQLRVFSMLRPVHELLPELEEFRPDVISSYGSYLEALFVHLREHRPRFTAPRVAVYGSDSMSMSIQRWARAALGTEVLGSYGAIEAPHIGFECERHSGYHLNVDVYPFRVIGADGHAVADGLPGEVVISNLVNRGTVLLNYRIGDVAAVVREPCQCGRNLPLGSYLDRTKAAWLDIGGGRAVHAQALRAVLRHEQEIWRYQIVQQAQRRLLLRLIPSPHCDRRATASRLIEGLRQQLPGDVSISVEFVADLPAGPSGKVQPVLIRSQALEATVPASSCPERSL